MPSTASPSGRSETGSWLIAVLLERGDGLAHPLGRPGDDEVRQQPGVVAVVEQVGDADDGAGRGQQAVGAHPLVVVDLREVAPAAVGQEHDDDGVARRRSSRASSPTTCSAATIAVPHEPPDRIPSSRVSRRAIANASRSLTRTQRSMTDGS